MSDFDFQELLVFAVPVFAAVVLFSPCRKMAGFLLAQRKGGDGGFIATILALFLLALILACAYYLLVWILISGIR